MNAAQTNHEFHTALEKVIRDVVEQERENHVQNWHAEDKRISDESSVHSFAQRKEIILQARIRRAIEELVDKGFIAPDTYDSEYEQRSKENIFSDAQRVYDVNEDYSEQGNIINVDLPRLCGNADSVSMVCNFNFVPGDLQGKVVHLYAREVAYASASFAQSLVVELLVSRKADKLVIIGGPLTLSRAIFDYALKEKVMEKVSLYRRKSNA